MVIDWHKIDQMKQEVQKDDDPLISAVRKLESVVQSKKTNFDRAGAELRASQASLDIQLSTNFTAVTIVATAQGITPQAVIKRIRQGKLLGLSVQGHWYVPNHIAEELLNG